MGKEKENKKEYTQRHILLGNKQIDFLKEIIDEVQDVKNISEAIRYAIDLAKTLKEQDDQVKVFQKKQNAMSKEISILIEMVAGSSEVLGVNDISEAKNTIIYSSAKKTVDVKIKKLVTKKSEIKKKNKVDNQILEKNNNFESDTNKNKENPIFIKGGGFNWQNQV